MKISWVGDKKKRLVTNDKYVRDEGIVESRGGVFV